MKARIVALAAASLLLSASAVSANWINDRFKFEFYADGVTPHIGTDLHNTHYTDFRHYDDYYRYNNNGFDNPRAHTSCTQTMVRGDNGQPIKRIVCQGRSTGPVGQ